MSASKKNGFTLIELLVVIAIIAILSTIGLVVYSSVQKNARISKRVQDLNAMKTALETYKAANGFYPSNAGSIYSGTPTCATATAATALGALVPTYMPVLPTDPLGTPYCYLYETSAGNGGSQEYKLYTNTIEMDDTVFRTQPNLIDPKRDNGTVDCAVELGAVTAWAVFNSNGTAATNGCAY